MVFLENWFVDNFINFGSLFSFLFGVYFGAVIFVLYYLFTVLNSLNKKRYLVNVQEYDVDGKEIELIVKQAQEDFKNKELRGEAGNIGHCINLVKQMVVDIATKFFPESKYPLLEISIDECLILTGYITKRLEELLDHRGIRMLRKIKISTIVGWTNVKKTVDDTAIMQTTKKYKLKQKFQAVMGAINIVNPVYWFKRIVVNKSMDLVIRKICIVVIGIVGEETYKIYSKRVFNEEMYIDTGVDAFMDELKDDLDKEVEENVSKKEK